MNEEKKQQVIALGRLGWSLRRIQKSIGVRRETVATYLKAAGVGVRPPGAWGRQPPSKPANEIAAEPAPAKPAKEVITDSGAGVATNPAEQATPPQPGRSSSASACTPYREVIEAGRARGRNAMAIWQDLVDTCGFTAGYQSVRRFIAKLDPRQSPDARAVIATAPGE